MEHWRFFLQNLKKIRFQVWNFVKFQIWNRIIFNFFKKSHKYSKINEIYLFGNVSEQILSKIRTTFVRRFLQGISFIKNFPWELLLKWTRIKFQGNSLIFFFKEVIKKNSMGITYKMSTDQISRQFSYLFFLQGGQTKIQRISM